MPSATSLADQLAVSGPLARTVLHARHAVTRVLTGLDDRLLAVVGPCSIHDADAALAYALRLRGMAEELADDLLVVMRAYVEKPRSALGWPGLATDPGLDGTFRLGDGLALARKIMLDITTLGLPLACEWLNPALAEYFADLVTWGAIGARTVESQVHRQLASGLPMPVGMKNTTTGSVGPAIDAVRVAAAGHGYAGTGRDGTLTLLRTSGNPHCHVVLRGGIAGPNHTAPKVAEALSALRAAGLAERVVVDASHGNSGKDHERQRLVAGEIADQVAAGAWGIRGVLLESFLRPGRQDPDLGSPLVFGQSVTDPCLGWETTVEALWQLAEATRARRESLAANATGHLDVVGSAST
ncbi:3-deoxy-7-phosphoheptulonate synthase [Longimycelium tulufanense]|uniref:3-deoxy-7-phosphoheptulonate synthase n=1 Tax=Longimycelium tulufanense TaxID=907463 RepID=UPI001E560743|nr:3-deoxy-7-phosphoheptulonate synthase [Longimycelium tulufanense]